MAALPLPELPESENQAPSEKLAAEALVAILQRSRVAASAFVEFVCQTGIRLHTRELAFRLQGPDADRPELALLDQNGREVLVIQTMFWDRLPQAVPVEALKRFPQVGDAAVLVVAPPGRFEPLWTLLVARARTIHRHADEVGRSGHWRAALIDGGRKVVLASWPALLRAMTTAVLRASTRGTLLALTQLQSLCAREDEGAFMPLQPGELVSRESRRLRDFVHLAESLAQHAARSGVCTVEDEGPPRTGPGPFERKLRIRGVPVELWANPEWAAKYPETPLWISLEAAGNEAVRKALKDLEEDSPPRLVSEGPRLLLPLLPLLSAEREAVVMDLAEQLGELASRIGGLEAAPR
jgi:hypothetical protein